MYRVMVFKNYGPFEFKRETYEDAIKTLKEKWFSPGVWNVCLFKGNEEIDITAMVKSWGARPVYC